MSARRSTIVLATVAAVLVAAAAVVRFVVAPGATKLPDDTDQKVHYTGRATLLDAEALKSGDTAHALRSGIPVTVERHVRAVSTHGDTAVLKDTLTVRAGEQSMPSSKTYAVDRETREGTAPPSSTPVEPSRGALSSAFPPDAAQDDSYTYYDSTTRSIVPVRYTGSAQREGRAVNVYKITTSAPVKDPETLRTLPGALPKQLITGLHPVLDPAARARFTPAALAALPDPVPLTYLGRSTLVAYIDQQTGIAIDQTVDRTIVATADVGGEPTPLLPVSALTFEVTPESSKELAEKASSAGLLLTVITVAAPLTLLAVAAVLLAFAVLHARRRPTAPTAAPEGTRNASATGSG
ncbi:porin PorA family protein [Streptomyces sp. NPDC053750]|uniref:porin PorA family protein n=1 Tax=Streptomyces sp. NPDC053750 TaxID=3365714 RepID=UPI0037D863E3